MKRSDTAGSRHLLLLLAVVFAACGAQRTPQPPSSTPPPQQTAGPTIVLPDGFVVHVEVAADDPTREQGLMYRDRVADDRGMIFFFPQAGVYPFWMKNTLIPLDMIWIDQQKKVVHVARDVPPCKADPCPSYSPDASASYVLELAAGVAARHRVATGSVLDFKGLENIVIR
jgi:uncharacterized membrane protein (UPF0127 family)